VKLNNSDDCPKTCDPDRRDPGRPRGLAAIWWSRRCWTPGSRNQVDRRDGSQHGAYIQSVAVGSNKINSHIGGVTSVAEATGKAASDVLSDARAGQPIRHAARRGRGLPRQPALGI